MDRIGAVNYSMIIGFIGGIIFALNQTPASRSLIQSVEYFSLAMRLFALVNRSLIRGNAAGALLGMALGIQVASFL